MKQQILALDRKHQNLLFNYADGKLCKVYTNYNIENQQFEIVLEEHDIAKEINIATD